jgi:hypothetical protein
MSSFPTVIEASGNQSSDLAKPFYIVTPLNESHCFHCALCYVCLRGWMSILMMCISMSRSEIIINFTSESAFIASPPDRVIFLWDFLGVFYFDKIWILIDMATSTKESFMWSEHIQKGNVLLMAASFLISAPLLIKYRRAYSKSSNDLTFSSAKSSNTSSFASSVLKT